jgi:hypothetical protein
LFNDLTPELELDEDKDEKINQDEMFDLRFHLKELNDVNLEKVK